jgi:hypothetical protein
LRSSLLSTLLAHRVWTSIATLLRQAVRGMRVAIIFVLFCILCTGFSWVQYRRQGSAAKLIRPLLRVLHGQSSESLVDISPTNDRTILKEVMRRGDTAKAKAGNKDSVEIAWQIRDAGGSVLHDSNEAVRVAEPSSVGKQGDVLAHDKEVFSFQLGADPRQVILGWEHAVRTMHEGEKARVILSPQWAFGSKGAPPIIPPDATLHCELEVLRIIPALSKRFRTIGINESIEAELADSIDSGRSPIAQAVMHTDRSAQHSSNVGAAQGAGVIPLGGTPASEAAQGASVKEDGTTAKYFDSTKHKVDANLRLQGEGTGYEWSESKDSLDIDLPLRGALVSAGTRVSKTDVDVTVRYVAYHLSPHYTCSHPLQGPVIAVVSASMYNHEHSCRPDYIRVGLRGQAPLLEGPLHGKVDAADVAWALVDYDDVRQFRQQALQGVHLNLSKLYASRDFWATVLSVQYLQRQEKHAAAASASSDNYNVEATAEL